MTEELGLIRIINWHISRSFHSEITELLEMEGKGNALSISDISGKQPVSMCGIFFLTEHSRSK